MSPFVFALKRLVRRPLFVGMLLIYILAVAFAGNVGKEISLPPAGVYDGSSSEESGRIVSYLTANGFVECESPEAMIALIREGQLDCGVILPENLVELMVRNDLDGNISWIESPTAFVPELYKDHVAAAVFREHAPFITAKLFEGTDVPQEKVFEEYEKMFAEGYAFSLDNILMEGGIRPEDASRRSLVMGVSAILLCAIIFAFCADIADTSFRELVCRIGLAKAITATVIPGLIVRMILAGCAGCIGLLLTDAGDLILPLLVYVVLLTGVGLILSGLLRNVRLIYTLLSVVVAGSAALCPIYTDLALMSPVLAAVRNLFPPYWMWLLAENWPLGALAAILAVLGGIALLVLRYAAIGKHRLRTRK